MRSRVIHNYIADLERLLYTGALCGTLSQDMREAILEDMGRAIVEAERGRKYCTRPRAHKLGGKV